MQCKSGRGGAAIEALDLGDRAGLAAHEGFPQFLRLALELDQVGVSG